jgi:hypothetical protein
VGTSVNTIAGPVTCLPVRDTWQPLIRTQKDSNPTMRIAKCECRGRMMRFRQTPKPMFLTLIILSIKIDSTGRFLLETDARSELAHARSRQTIEILRQDLAKTSRADLCVRTAKPMAIEYVKHLEI